MMVACQHTPAPTGYLAWHEWAHQMSKTHRQVKCAACGRWAIWLPKRPGAMPIPPDGIKTCLSVAKE